MQIKKERVILHSDLNNFFASVECAMNPDLKGKPLAVCGSKELRHGIVLAKNEEAKKYGIKTTMTIGEAKRLCPSLNIVPPRHGLYVQYSQKVRNIYAEFTDRIEPFGIDEAWLDVTDSGVFGDGETIANKIRALVKERTGLTCSVGVSFNKAFAKLASDLKKPDATTVVSRADYRKIVWKLPVEDLLYVGRATLTKLNKCNIYTIGDLALSDDKFIINKFGKAGETLLAYARGQDESPVRLYGEEEECKSVGNSITAYRDLENLDDVKNVLAYLSDSVSERILRYGLGKAKTVHIYVRDSALTSMVRQTKLEYPSSLSRDIYKAALSLFEKSYSFARSVRTLGVTASDFSDGIEQLAMGRNEGDYEKRLNLEKKVNALREKYGKDSVRLGVTLHDKNFGYTSGKNGDDEVNALSREAEIHREK